MKTILRNNAILVGKISTLSRRNRLFTSKHKLKRKLN